MSNTIKCDRCRQSVEGAIAIDSNFTCGGYLVIGTSWEKYSYPGERFVCDKCMWSNPRYILDYGTVNIG